MFDVPLRERVKSDFDATAELSQRALAKLQEHSPAAHELHHAHGGCGCA
jgi:hypothetical protein